MHSRHILHVASITPTSLLSEYSGVSLLRCNASIDSTLAGFSTLRIATQLFETGRKSPMKMLSSPATRFNPARGLQPAEFVTSLRLA